MTPLDHIPNATTVMTGLLTALVKRMGGRIKISQAELASLLDNEIVIESDEQLTFHMLVRPRTNGDQQTESTGQP